MIKKIIVIIGVILYCDLLEATLYYNNYFDNSIYKESYNTNMDAGILCYGVSTVKLINDTNLDDPPTCIVVDSSANRILWSYHNLSDNYWYICAFGNYGSGDGQFQYPKGITANSSGNIYVSDTLNDRIVKLYYDIIKPEMRFVKNFGSGMLNSPQQVALDKQGNVYVCDTGNNRICKFNSDGVLLQTIGSTGYGNGQFQNPMGVSVSIVDGSIYVADTGNGRLQKFDSSGNFIKEFRRSSEQPLTATYFSLDSDIFGNVYAVDSVNNLVYKFTPELEFVMSTSGKPDSPFQNLHGISCDKSYDANGVWFSSGNCFTVENTRGQYFDIGMDVVEVSCGQSVFYPLSKTNNVAEVKYRLTDNGEVTINVKDESGTSIIRNLVSNSLEGTGNHTHTWDGRDNNGKVMAEGMYRFEIIANDLYNEGNGNKQVFKYTDSRGSVASESNKFIE